MRDYESCVLGSINLARYVGPRSFRWDELARDIPLYVEALDRMIDVARYPIPEIEQATKLTRRIGLGVMGWAECLMRLGIPYDSKPALELAGSLGSFIRVRAHEASYRLAGELGPYPAWEASPTYPDGPFKPRQRNAYVTLIAPTGTISTLADTTPGIEPCFALSYKRQHRLDKHDPESLTDYLEVTPAYREIYPGPPPEHFRTAHEISPQWYAKMQAAWQSSFADNAVSMTNNLPHASTVEDVKATFRLLWDLGCLGGTVYRDGSRGGQVYTPADCNGPACALEPEADNGANVSVLVTSGV